MKGRRHSIYRANVCSEQRARAGLVEIGDQLPIWHSDSKQRSAAAKKNIAQRAGDRGDVVQYRGQRRDLERGRQSQPEAQRLIPGHLDELHIHT